MNNSISVKRENWIDVIKGFAIILVVLGHITETGDFITNWIYSFHIPIFFIVTGILLSINEKWKSESTINIVRRKAKALLYPYYIFSLSAVVIDYILNKNIKYTVAIVLKTLYFNGSDVLWYLPALLFAECLFIYIYKSKLPKVVVYIGIIAVSTFVAFYYTMYAHDKTGAVRHLFRMINVVNHSLIGSVFIMIGYVLNKYFISSYCENDKRCNRDIMIFIAAVVVFIANIFICQYNGSVDLHISKINNASMYYLFAVLTSISVICIVKFAIKKCAFFEFFGRNSLIIMITHFQFMLIPLSEKILSIFNINISGILYSLLSLIIVIAIEIPVILVINKYMPFLLKPPKKSK